MNAFEEKVAAAYAAQGWTVLHDGWPDFLCFRKNADGTISVMAVEAKSETDPLRENQKLNMLVLSTVMPVREVRAGPGYGDTLNRSDMHALIYDRERHERFEGEI